MKGSFVNYKFTSVNISFLPQIKFLLFPLVRKNESTQQNNSGTFIYLKPSIDSNRTLVELFLLFVIVAVVVIVKMKKIISLTQYCLLRCFIMLWSIKILRIFDPKTYWVQMCNRKCHFMKSMTHTLFFISNSNLHHLNMVALNHFPKLRLKLEVWWNHRSWLMKKYIKTK